MYQSVTVAGNLGRDPEMRFFPDGTAVTNFSVATNRRWTDGRSGEQKEETTWFRVSVFGKQAEACNQYLSQGRQVIVEGRLIPDEHGGPKVWTASDGTVRASFELRANTVRFLGGAGDSNDGQGHPAGASQAPQEQEEDEIPF